MTILSTVFKIPVKAQIGFLKLDASLSETHNRTAQVTDNEVEDGTVVSDHIKLNPKTLSISGQISDAPVSILGLGVSSDDILGAAQDFAGGDKGAFEGLVKNPKRKPDEAWGYLNQLMEKRSPFSVVTGLQRYENMTLTSLSAPRSSKDGKSLMFTGELKQVVIVKSSTVKIPAFKMKDDAKGGSSKGKLGKQNGKNATDAQANNSSFFLKLTQKAGLLP